MASKGSSGREYLKYAGVGFEFAAMVGVFAYFGYKADEWWGWEPWGLMAGTGIGLIGGIYLLAREGEKMMKDLDKPRKPDSGDPC